MLVVTGSLSQENSLVDKYLIAVSCIELCSLSLWSISDSLRLLFYITLHIFTRKNSDIIMKLLLWLSKGSATGLHPQNKFISRHC